jgi:co-chaperonin GroES (HSP10)
MKSPYMFIVRPTDGKRYANTQGNLIVNTSEEDHLFSNREAEVVETPVNYAGPIKKGHKLMVHHNVFKFYNDMKGRRKSGRSHFKDDLFFVEDIQFFMYNDGSGWKARDKYCFVRPIKTEESIIYKNITEEPLVGEMVYPNDQLDMLGVKAGDKVSFTPESEYEFQVDGEKLYRMYTDNITMVL